MPSRAHSPGLIARIPRLSVTLGLLVLSSPGIRAQVADSSAVPACAQMSDSALARFVDEHFGSGIRDYNVPGGVFIAVREGQVVVKRGFGFADLERRLRADPDSTIFFTGSQSKIITATAAMQLVEAGKLDLDANVETYLGDGFHLRSPEGEPITLRNLLTHTAGVDQRGIGIAVHERDRLEPLGEHLARRMPPLVKEPGDAFDYSNYGIALVGYIVERTSGEPFPEYVRRHILAPLRMRHSGFDVSHDDPNLAQSYQWLFGRKINVGSEQAYFNIGPAVGFAATASDMAKFLIAQLGDGSYEGARILSPESVREMQKPQWSLDPRLAGSGLGFRYRMEQGLQVFGHRGLVNQHSSILQIIPSANTAFFVACNSAMCARMEPMVDQLLDDVLCGHAPAVRPAAAALDVASLAGSYRPDRQAVTNIEKVRGLFDEFEFEASHDTLLVHLPNQRAAPFRFVATGPAELQRVDAEGLMLLVPDSSGHRRLFAASRSMPLEEMQPLRVWETAGFVQKFGVAAAGGLASVVVLLPAALIYRRRRGSRQARGLPALASMNAVLVALLLLGFLFQMARVLTAPVETAFIFGVPAPVKIALVFPLLGLLLALPLPAYAVAAWRRRLWTVPERAYYTLMVAGMGLLFLLLHYWNLIGFRY